VKSVVYYRDLDPPTLLSPVPFHGSYFHKLQNGELDKGSEEVRFLHFVALAPTFAPFHRVS